ncbi:MAG: MarR family winged helix-turn-helix transcriptional regulator [Roseburia sp.]
MDKVSEFREYTRQLEFQLANMNKKDCCCCNISTTQCFMLVEIGRRPGISLKELAAILRMDKGGVSRSIEDLVRKEYVERKTSEEDRRWVALFLLQKGQEHFEKIERDMNSKFQDILNEIPEEKQNQVIEALQLYVGACRKVEEQKND